MKKKKIPLFFICSVGHGCPPRLELAQGAYSAQLVKGSRNPKPACPGTSFLNPNLSHCSLLEPGSLPWPWGPTATLLAFQAVSSTLSSLELLRKQQGFVTCSNLQSNSYLQCSFKSSYTEVGQNTSKLSLGEPHSHLVHFLQFSYI